MPVCNLFISYSHEDQKYLDELKTHIDNSIPNLNIWDDVKIELGDKWDETIKNRIITADIVLLIVSQDFLRSTYINAVELKTALERNRLAKCMVIPIFARDCDLDNYKDITAIQGIPIKPIAIDETSAPGGPAPETAVLGTHITGESASVTFLTDYPTGRDKQYLRLRKRIKEIAASMEDRPVRTPARDLLKLITNLENKKKIFLSISNSEAGLRKRNEFINQATNRAKRGDWDYEIIPGIDSAADILTKPEDEQVNILEGFIRDSIYSIHIYDKENFNEPLTSLQYDLAQKSKALDLLFKNIIWISDPEIEGVLRSLLINPAVKECGASKMFEMIADQDMEKKKILDAFRRPRRQKVYMLYDFKKDHDNPTRVRLKNKLEEHLNVIGRDIPEEKLLEEKRIIDECQGAVIFYGSSDFSWYVKRQDTLISEPNIKRAVCIDEPRFQKKVDADIWKNEFDIIRGKGDTEFELDTDIFINQLKNR
jgi:hypothetical protein